MGITARSTGIKKRSNPCRLRRTRQGTEDTNKIREDALKLKEELDTQDFDARLKASLAASRQRWSVDPPALNKEEPPSDEERRRLKSERAGSKTRWRRLKELRPIHRLYNEIL